MIEDLLSMNIHLRELTEKIVNHNIKEITIERISDTMCKYYILYKKFNETISVTVRVDNLFFIITIENIEYSCPVFDKKRISLNIIKYITKHPYIEVLKLIDLAHI